MAATRPLKLLLLALAGWISRHQQDVIDYLVEENRVLKEQLGGERLRLTDDQRRRLAAKGKRIGRQALNRAATIVTQDTIMRWHRRLIAQKWTYETKRVGRPGLMKAIKALIVRMARENSSWGYCRIQGELKGLGHRVSSTTIATVLTENGIKPAPGRPSSWRSFLNAHRGQVAAMDSFTTEVWTWRGLRTVYVLFAIDLKSRRVHLARLTPNPDDEFMAQIARYSTDMEDSVLLGHRALICDRDGKFTPQFRRILSDAGVDIPLTPRQAPSCNGYAERSVLSVKSGCLDRMIVFGERSLRRAIPEYRDHYETERPHQGIGNHLITARGGVETGPVECGERLGGILKSYRRAA